jgi:hypothetical protein
VYLYIFFSNYLFFLQIKLENRFRNDRGRRCKMTVDGTDVQIWEPRPFSKTWYSHKFKGAGLRYEIAVCIQTGDIVWVNGPFKCGKWADLSIFRNNLKNLLLPREQVEADKGYRGDPSIRSPAMARSWGELQKKKAARTRHNTLNGRLKKWGILNQVYRHSLDKHRDVFMAVCVLTQLTIDRGSRPYQMNC